MSKNLGTDQKPSICDGKKIQEPTNKIVVIHHGYFGVFGVRCINMHTNKKSVAAWVWNQAHVLSCPRLAYIESIEHCLFYTCNQWSWIWSVLIAFNHFHWKPNLIKGVWKLAQLNIRKTQNLKGPAVFKPKKNSWTKLFKGSYARGYAFLAGLAISVCVDWGLATPDLGYCKTMHL